VDAEVQTTDHTRLFGRLTPWKPVIIQTNQISHAVCEAVCHGLIGYFCPGSLFPTGSEYVVPFYAMADESKNLKSTGG
jgi:hypothetical protein